GDLRIDPDPVARLTIAAKFLDGADGSWARGEPFQSDGSVLHGSNGTMASLAGLEAARTDEEREHAFRRIALLNALSIASGGLATLYMGDEAGLLNDHSYRDDPDRAHEGRWLHRPVMDWDALDRDAARRISGDIRRSAPRASPAAGPARLRRSPRRRPRCSASPVAATASSSTSRPMRSGSAISPAGTTGWRIPPSETTP
ncbi:hypothetical protein NI18_15540, partial [Sphingomonas sp. Ant20]